MEKLKVLRRFLSGSAVPPANRCNTGAFCRAAIGGTRAGKVEEPIFPRAELLPDLLIDRIQCPAFGVCCPAEIRKCGISHRLIINKNQFEKPFQRFTIPPNRISGDIAYQLTISRINRIDIARIAGFRLEILRRSTLDHFGAVP